MIALCLFIFWIICLLITYDLDKKYTLPKYHIRKLFHSTVGIELAVVLPFITSIEYYLLAGFLLVYLLFDYFRKQKINSLIFLSGKKNYGSIVYPISLILLKVAFPEDIALTQLGLLLLAIPDSVAGYVNYFLKKTRKTYISSIIFFLLSILISIFYLEILESFVLGLVLSVIERYTPKGLDNLTVPLIYIILALLFFQS